MVLLEIAAYDFEQSFAIERLGRQHLAIGRMTQRHGEDLDGILDFPAHGVVEKEAVSPVDFSDGKRPQSPTVHDGRVHGDSLVYGSQA